MVVAGVVLFILGLLFGLGWLWIIGLILIVVGLVANVGYARPRGGRYWY